MNRYEFYYFTDDFISKIKQFNGLYAVFELCFRNKINIISDKSDLPLVDSFDNIVLELYYKYYSLCDNIFDQEYVEIQATNIYDTSICLLNSENSKVETELINNLIYNVCTNYLQFINSNFYSLTKYLNQLSLFSDIKKFYNKKEFTVCLQLMHTFESENGPVPYLSFVHSLINFEEKKQYENVQKIIDSINAAYGLHIQENSEIQRMNEIHVYFQRTRIIGQFIINPNLYTGFPCVLLINDFPKYFPCQKYFKHLEMLRYNKISNYEDYLVGLLKEKNFLFSKLFHDYMTIINNKKNFQANVDFYKIYKKYIHYYLKKCQCPIFRYNLFIIVQQAYFNTDQLYENNQFLEFVKSFDISVDIHKRYGKDFEKLQKQIQNIEELIQKKQFSVCRENNLTDDVCMICQDNLSDIFTATMKCNGCKKELGHVSCLLKWIKLENSRCPNCRLN
jgi:hypothetical protein